VGGEAVSPTIGVVVPAFRAEATLRDVLLAIPPSVAHVFVVDDASPDQCGRVAESLGDPRVRLIRHEANRGVGGAVKTGYRAALEAGCDVIVKMDADGQMDAAHLDELVRPLRLGHAGYAKGNRLRTLEAAREMPRRRLYGNLFLSLATKAVSGYWNLLDPTNGYTAIRADVLRRLDFARLQERYFFETSMLVELHPLRVPVRDVPMSARYQGEPSSLRLLPVSLEFGARLLRALLHRLRLEYLVLDFRPASGFALFGMLLAGFGGGFGAWHWYRSIVDQREASAGTVMLAALPFLLGVQFLVQAVVLDIAEVRDFPPLPPLD
jgi:glycosyltransferase involved in cell wall biosynthesis